MLSLSALVTLILVRCCSSEFKFSRHLYYSKYNLQAGTKLRNARLLPYFSSTPPLAQAKQRKRTAISSLATGKQSKSAQSVQKSLGGFSMTSRAASGLLQLDQRSEKQEPGIRLGLEDGSLLPHLLAEASLGHVDIPEKASGEFQGAGQIAMHCVTSETDHVSLDEGHHSDQHGSRCSGTYQHVVGSPAPLLGLENHENSLLLGGSWPWVHASSMAQYSNV